MADYTINIEGVPFRVKKSGFGSQEEAQQFWENEWHTNRSDEQKQQAMQNRVAELQDMGIDLGKNYAVEGMGTAEKVAVGAGRTLTRLGRGVQQRLSAGDPNSPVYGLDFTGEGLLPSVTRETAAQSQGRERSERETFSMLDNSSRGIGAEDIGELLPELIAFIGTGGIGGLAARGAMLGAADATVEGESVTKNALIGGVAAGVGGAVGKGAAAGLARMFKPGATFSGASAQGLASLMKSIKDPAKAAGTAARKVAEAFRQADVLDSSASKALREVGDQAYNQTRTLVQQMNAVGRQSVFRENVNSIFKNAIKTSTDGRIQFKPDAFVKELEQYSRGRLVKELGKNIGPRLDNIRTTFREVGKLKDLGHEEAVAVLKGLFDDPTSQALSRQLGKEPTKKMADLLVERAVAYSARGGAALPGNDPGTVGF